MDRGPQLGDPISKESRELILAMMAIEPASRPESYADLIARIDRLPAMQRLDSMQITSAKSQIAVRRGIARNGWFHSGVFASLMAVSVAVFLMLRHPGAPFGAAATYISDGDQYSLFDNETLAGWLPPNVGGVWQTEIDEDQDTILSGVGFTHRRFANLENYRLAIGLDVHDATAAEVHFAIPAVAPDQGKRCVLRVSRKDGAIFGTRAGDKGAFTPLAEPVAYPPPSWFEGRQPYLEVRLERSGGVWRVWFNGKLAGGVNDDASPKAAELRLFADAGQARVNSVVLTPLKRE
jgi:hypothetical protein